MKRRTLLKAMASGLVTPLIAGRRTPLKRAVNKGGSLKKLLVIFQRGGNDGLNTLVPVDNTQYSLYQNLRPQLAIPQGNLLNIPGTSFFGAHPGLAPLQSMIDAGQVSLFHAVGYPNPDRSHFESQSYFETAVPGNGLLSGWINRLLEFTPGTALIRGVAIGWSIPQSVTGNVAIPVSTNFGTAEIGADNDLSEAQQDAYRAKLQQLIELAPTSGNDKIYDTGNKIFQMVASFADRNLDDYTPEGGAQYPAGFFGNNIRHAAQMLKDSPTDLGIEVAVIDQDGYDTHAAQIEAGGAASTTQGHGFLLRELSEGIAAFTTDMGNTRMQDTLILVVTEFGRRAYQNDSFGTDHGTGSVAMAIGPVVNGQVYNGGGSWPGLAQSDLFEGEDLNWNTDFRDIYWEVLSRHMGVDNGALAQIIPGHTYSPLNFI